MLQFFYSKLGFILLVQNHSQRIPFLTDSCWLVEKTQNSDSSFKGQKMRTFRQIVKSLHGYEYIAKNYECVEKNTHVDGPIHLLFDCIHEVIVVTGALC